MNQIFNPTALTEEGPEPRSMTTSDGSPVRTRADRIEYDDGNPATIAPRRNGSTAMAHLPCSSDPCGDADASARFRRPLTAHNGDARMEYDDGDPATIAPEI